MAGAKPNRAPKAERKTPFFDAEERDLIESFEQALDNGEVSLPSAEELAETKAKWKKIATAHLETEAVSLRLSSHDVERIKREAGQRGVSYEELMASVLHAFALETTK